MNAITECVPGKELKAAWPWSRLSRDSLVLQLVICHSVFGASIPHQQVTKYIPASSQALPCHLREFSSQGMFVSLDPSLPNYKDENVSF